MREKLLDLMKCEGLKPSQLAEILGINPAGISHILAGRNKPGFDLLQKILRRFPRINPDWLLLDSGAMYRDAGNDTSQSPINPIVNNSLFDIQDSDTSQRVAETSASATTHTPEIPGFPTSNFAKSGAVEIERIVVFYTDRTFENFHPKK